MNETYVKFYRKLSENPISSNLELLGFFSYLLLNVNFKEGSFFIGFEKITIKSGQILTSQRKLAEKFGVSLSKINRMIKILEKEGIVKHEKNTKFTLIELLSWDKYQGSETPMKHEGNTNETREETIKEELRIIKNNKEEKEKNIKKEKSFFNFFKELKILKKINFEFEKFVDRNGEVIFGNENFCEELKYFYEMRKDIKAPMSARALELLCLKARNYDLNIFIKMIQQSTENSWKGIYDLKNNFSQETQKISSSYEKQEQEIQERFKKFKQKQIGNEK
ncbi:hypothetical protein DLH72_04005 [Candidatus Gracilibacteria bacterium]|nr:MAG: hypothetical protein DLH72_04005 [Candidatus Gracilibacteria bacterium]